MPFTQGKVIILTGASRGIGLAIAHYLLQLSNKLVIVARSVQPLEAIKKHFPGQVELVAADATDFSVAQRVISLTIDTFSRIDGVIINHGTLGECNRIADSTPEEWRNVFDVNFFSALAFIRAALPALRETKGRIVLVSSGAATSGRSTWGAYGSSKAALYHIVMTLKSEEPLITAIAIRPGNVDTEMQRQLREVHNVRMDGHDVKEFADKYKEGKLLKPEQPGNVIARLALNAPGDLKGKLLTWNDEQLAAFQDP